MEYKTPSKIITRIILGQPIASVRLMAALFVIGASAMKLLTDYYIPEFVDSSLVRWSLIGLVAAYFVFMYIYRVPTLIAFGTLILYSAVLVYSVYLLVVNLFHPAAVIFFLLILAGGTITINSMLIYIILSFHILLSLFITFNIYSLTNEQIISFYNIIISILVFGVILHIRLKLRSSVAFHHSYLERINALSIIVNKLGEVIFISPSIKKLLGYQPKEVLGQNWWGIDSLARCWISKEHILLFPNIMQSDLKTFESEIKTKSGETIWLNWNNSVLPNGNYMGIGLDITQYKKNLELELRAN